MEIRKNRRKVKKSKEQNGKHNNENKQSKKNEKLHKAWNIIYISGFMVLYNNHLIYTVVVVIFSVSFSFSADFFEFSKFFKLSLATVISNLILLVWFVSLAPGS